MTEFSFTSESLRGIEEELNIVLPATYKQVVCPYPYNEEHHAYDWKLCATPERVIEINSYFRNNHFFGQTWPKNYFIIGEDGLGNLFYLDLTLNDSPVFFADHENTAVADQLSTETEAGNLIDYIRDTQETEREIQEETRRREERKLHKQWWQFWI